MPNLIVLLAAAALSIGLSTSALAQQAPSAQPTPSQELLTPQNHTLILIDHQPQMAFAANSIPTEQLINNVTLVAKSAALFDVPTILTTVAEQTFSGPIFPAIQAVFPDSSPIDRTTMNAWEDERITARVNEIGRPKIVIAALWTEVCGVFPVLSALEQGYEVSFITDASGGMSDGIHDDAVDRMVQAGATPITAMQYLLELQRDWARQDTYAETNRIVMDHGGAYGLGVLYAREMFGGGEGGN
ncbi:MAG: hydrolase [Inquilinaceae bacterium]